MGRNDEAGRMQKATRIFGRRLSVHMSEDNFPEESSVMRRSLTASSLATPSSLSDCFVTGHKARWQVNVDELAHPTR